MDEIRDVGLKIKHPIQWSDWFDDHESDDDDNDIDAYNMVPFHHKPLDWSPTCPEQSTNMFALVHCVPTSFSRVKYVVSIASSLAQSLFSLKQIFKSSLLSRKSLVVPLSLMMCTNFEYCECLSYDEITEFPLNDAVTVGSRANFKLRSNISMTECAWLFIPSSQEVSRHFINSPAEIGLITYDGYFVNRTLPEQYDLIIPKSRYSHGGMYQLEVGISAATAFLNVMDSPECFVDHVVSDRQTAKCTIVYTGFLKPQMKWDIAGAVHYCNTTFSKHDTKNIASCSVTTFGVHALETLLVCTVYFTSSDTGENFLLLQKAMNIPSFSESCRVTVAPIPTTPTGNMNSKVHVSQDQQLLLQSRVIAGVGLSIAVISLVLWLYDVTVNRKSKHQERRQSALIAELEMLLTKSKAGTARTDVSTSALLP